MISQELKTASDDKLREVLEYADPLILRGMIYHVTGDDSVFDMETKRIQGAFGDAPTIDDPASLELLRKKGLALLKGYRDGTIEVPGVENKERLRKAMSLAVAEEVPEDEYDFWIEEFAIDPTRRQHHWKAPPDAKKLENFKVIVIGAGLGGLNASIQLKKAGFNFEVFDKNLGVGGTWHQNKYPGARVDLPSRLYSHSIAMNFHFRHRYAPQEENERYVNWLADEFDLRKSIKLGVEVLGLNWTESTGSWAVRIRNADGREETRIANAVICAVGFLDRPSLPTIPGMDSFSGRLFHTTTFDPTLELADKNVSVVGTGASGMQMVPDLYPLVKHLSVFQRSPGWVIPVPGYREPYSEELYWLQCNAPLYAHWTRLATAWAIGDRGRYTMWSVDPEWKEPNTVSRENFELRERLIAHLKAKIGHRPDLVDALVPNYPPLSKRYVVDNGWFDAVQKETVDLIANDPIDHFTKDSIVTKSGREVPTDVVVFATGFRANDYFWPMEVKGREGITVDEAWAKDGARAFWGINITGFPNFFCIYGPNTNPKNTGPVPYGEMQVRYILKCLGAMVDNNWKSIDVRPDVYDEHNRIVDQRNASSIFLDKRQKSYYTNQFGRSAVASPWRTIEYWNKLRDPDFNEYIIEQKSNE